MPKDKIDSYLITINIAVVVGFLFVFQSNLNNEAVKWLILLSFITFTVSLVLLLWFLNRYPKRSKILDELREKTVKKFSARISSFIKDIAVPFERLKARDETLKRLETVKTKEEHEELIKDINTEIKALESGKKASGSVVEMKATDYILDSFLEHMANESRNDYQKAFKKPLDEKFSRIKHILDRVSFKARRHFFAAASALLFFSIFIEIMSK